MSGAKHVAAAMRRLGVSVLTVGFVGGTFLAEPAAADERPVSYDPGVLADCLSAAEGATDEASCIGRGAQACMEKTDAGGSTVGMGFCLGAELKDWDVRLNQVYGVLRGREKAMDDEMASYKTQGTPTVPQIAPALKTMQRAWIAYRDAACAYEVTHWGGGTGGGPAWSGCMMDLTARQAIALRARMETKQ